LVESAMATLNDFGARAETLNSLARFLVQRKN
jgi:hypothetical protein